METRVKIGLISSVALRTFPRTYGGLEAVCGHYAQGLTRLGHDVTVFGAKESKVEGVNVVGTVTAWDELNDGQRNQYTRNDGVDRQWEDIKWRAHTYNGWRAHEEEAFGIYKDQLGEFGVLGDHSWAKWSYSTDKKAVVGTCHSIQPHNSKPPREFANFTGVSKGHAAKIAETLKIPVKELWNPVDLDEFPLERIKTDRVLSFNRVMPTKGIHFFVGQMEKLKLKADIAGDDSTLVPDQGYVQFIKQSCAKSANLTYHGLVDNKKRVQLLKDAKALVCMKDGGYEEVFGLSAVEALATGTPVVAMKTWGLNDIIEQGVNGVLCDTPDQVGDYVWKIVQGDLKFDPEKCRASVERFSIEESSKRYEVMLKAVADGQYW